MMFTNLHYVGILLNPFLMHVMEIQNNSNNKRALNKVVQKLGGNALSIIAKCILSLTCSASLCK
jgi:hypothetical protein